MATKQQQPSKSKARQQVQPSTKVIQDVERKQKEEMMSKVPARTTGHHITEDREIARTGGHSQVTKAPENMDPALFERMKRDAGGGLSKDQADNLVPLIYLLQPLSPQVMKGDPAQIKGAEAGDIWLRNAEDPIAKGEEGILFQPCHFWKDIVEWIPNRGGFVGRHDISCLPNVSMNKGWTGTLKDVQEIEDDENPNAWPRYVRSSNNNEVVETRYFAGNVYFDDGRLPLPFIIPLSSTGHSFGKQWMFLQNSQTLPDGTPNDKAWVFIYRLKTTMKSNSKGSWYMYTVQKERMVQNMDEYELGLKLNQAFATGEKKIDDEMMDQAAGADKAANTPLNNDEPM